MRRTLALLLVALFSVPLFTPLLAADQRRELPACCRRDGQHHCSMPSRPAAAQSDGPALEARCSLYPRASSFFSGPQSARLAAPAEFQVPQRCAANLADQVESAALSTVFGAPDSRGPPPFLE